MLEQGLHLFHYVFIQRRRRSALAGDFGGYPLKELGFRPWINQQIQFRLAQHIDKPRGNYKSRSIDSAPGLGMTKVGNSRHAVTTNSYVSIEPWTAGAIHDAPIRDYQVVRLRRRHSWSRADEQQR